MNGLSFSELMSIRGDIFLEELDDLNVEVVFQTRPEIGCRIYDYDKVRRENI